MKKTVQQLEQFIDLLAKALDAGAKFKHVSHRRLEFVASTRHTFYKLVVDLGTTPSETTVFEFYGVGDTYLTSFTTLDPILDDEADLRQSLDDIIDRITASAGGGSDDMAVLIGRFNKSLELHAKDYLPKKKRP